MFMSFEIRNICTRNLRFVPYAPGTVYKQTNGMCKHAQGLLLNCTTGVGTSLPSVAGGSFTY